eukprot:CAMPEP_0176482878 /NCGR_PEP_ID=MMETSP0200_2-20121128/3617_1 /TAXON_ID=947934 /ORGANISM="Chaetoceros sp., Strain GSL56" /LENGTH=207 /DNA_ID=CAMNT_0017879237 /DNA_START=79 /DNA_END=699 /DNA_ORIENTATION=+
MFGASVVLTLILLSWSCLLASSSTNGYTIVSDKVVYSRWRSIISRKVITPKGQQIDYDVVDQKGSGASIVFAWNSKTKTATIVKEYNPGCDKILYGLAAGVVETDKHGSDFDLAARHELEEECHLSGGTWYRLLKEDKSIAMDKYVMTKIVAYLVVDANEVSKPRPLDDEEEIEIIEGVTVEEILEIIRRGEMNCIGGFASLLAFEK